MRGRGVVRRVALGTRGAPPTAPVGQRSRGAGIPEVTARAVLELAVRIGEAMLSLGAPAADVTEAIKRVVRAFGLKCQVDLTFTAILVSHDPGPEAPPITVLRVVTTRVPDYGRLSQVIDLARDVGEGATRRPDSTEPSPAVTTALVENGHDRLDEIVTAPHPYSRSLVTALLSLMAAAVAVLLGGGLWVALVAGATTALIDFVTTRLGRWGLPPFFLQVVGAALATGVAVLLLAVVPLLPVDLATLPPSLVVASGIVVLLAGLSLVGAGDDAINGFPVTATGRVFEVLLLTLGIVVGIGSVLAAARRGGVTLNFVDMPANGTPLWLQAVSAGVVAGAWALASYARPRAALVVTVVAGAAWLLFIGLGHLGLGAAGASAGAAFAIGFAAESGSRRLRVPAIVTSMCGIVPLLPGLMIYRGLFGLVDEGSAGGGSQILLEAALVGVALAAGVTLGELLAQPMKRRIRRSPLAARRHAPEKSA